MRKAAVMLAVAAVAVVLALRLVRHDDEPVMVGQWRELRPPDFA